MKSRAHGRSQYFFLSDDYATASDQLINGPLDHGVGPVEFCVGGAWKMPSGKYLCLVEPATNIDAWDRHSTHGEDKSDLTGMCTERGFDHFFEPRTREDTVEYLKLEQCKTCLMFHSRSTMMIFQSNSYVGLAETGYYVVPGQKETSLAYMSLMPGRQGFSYSWPKKITMLNSELINHSYCH